jgi:prepilin-type N-terminal cleavage/methylation domain-containing protein
MVRLRRAQDGFTLVELLVVLVILAVLMLVAVTSYLGFRDRAADRVSQAALRQAVPSAHAYAGDHDGAYLGMTAALLQSQYDRGLTDVEVIAADDDSYCLRSTVNDRVWYGSGPPLTLSRSACS